MSGEMVNSKLTTTEELIRIKLGMCTEDFSLASVGFPDLVYEVAYAYE